MGAQVRKVYPDMFEEVYTSLLRDFDPGMSRNRWRSIFEPGWKSPEEHVGYALFSGGRMVGFAGYLFSEIQVGERVEKFCNFTSWVAKEPFRRDSISLLLPLRSLRDFTITNMSSTNQVRQIFLRLGFRILEESTIVVRPSFPLTRRGGRDQFRVLSDPCIGEIQLEQPHRRFLEDHAPYGHQILMESGKGLSYGIYTLRRRRRLKTALFHYLSDPQVFVQALPVIRPHLFRRHRSVLVEFDSRFLGGRKISASYRVRRALPRLFKSPTLPREAVPNLYSESILLNLE